jgi:hypothetical protein
MKLAYVVIKQDLAREASEHYWTGDIEVDGKPILTSETKQAQQWQTAREAYEAAGKHGCFVTGVGWYTYRVGHRACG